MFPSQNYFIAGHLCWTICYSPATSRTLRSLFTNVSYTNLWSIVAIFAFILSIDYRQYQHTFYSILKFFFATSFPKIFNFYLLCFCSLWASGTKLHFPCMSRTQNTKNNFFFYWLHFFFSWLFLYHKEVTRVFSSKLNFAWQFSCQWNRRCAILPKTQICKFGRRK